MVLLHVKPPPVMRIRKTPKFCNFSIPIQVGSIFVNCVPFGNCQAAEFESKLSGGLRHSIREARSQDLRLKKLRFQFYVHLSLKHTTLQKDVNS